jgi:hypothetical protein
LVQPAPVAIIEQQQPAVSVMDDLLYDDDELEVEAAD